MRLIVIFASLLMVALPAQAYIGPGLGAGTLGVILGVIGSFFLAIFALFYYPLKRLIKGEKPDVDGRPE